MPEVLGHSAPLAHELEPHRIQILDGSDLLLIRGVNLVATLHQHEPQALFQQDKPTLAVGPSSDMDRMPS